MSSELFQALVNGGGFAVMIWLVAGMRADQAEQIKWMRQIVQMQIEAKADRVKIAEALNAKEGNEKQSAL